MQEANIMGRYRNTSTDDTTYAKRRNIYLKNRVKILAKAKELYKLSREARLNTAQAIRDAARDARLLAKRLEDLPAYRRSVQEARAYVKDVKDGAECVDCKKSFPYYVLDFDHVRDTKIRDISSLVAKGASLNSIRREIAKCDLVCANCHRMRTFRSLREPDTNA